jgi:hypothetical protein
MRVHHRFERLHELDGKEQGNVQLLTHVLCVKLALLGQGTQCREVITAQSGEAS